MFVLDRITINLNNPAQKPRVYATILDDGTRAVEVSLCSNGSDWIIPADAHCVIRFAKPDGHKGAYFTLPDGTNAWNTDGNILTIKLAPQVVTCPGLVEVSAALVRGEERLGVFGFEVHVVHDPLADLQESSDYFTLNDLAEINMALAGLTAKITTDPTLSVAGTPADAASVGAKLAETVPVARGGTGAMYPAKARLNLKTPFSTSLYVVKNASFIIEGDNNHSREIPVKVILCHKSGYMCEIIFMVNCQTGVPVGTNFIRWGNLRVTSFLYETTGNQTHYTISVDKSGAYTFGSLTFDNTYAVGTTADHSAEYVINMNAYTTFSDLTEGTPLNEATLV